jgi:uroporphyrin-III C-methyltransferase/precorrin-2 dehydrogenase/sirohydrochlorin ferrochelatase
MDFLPIFLDLKEKPCLVVGGGQVAGRKVALLRKAGARVRVVAPELGRELVELVQAGQVEHAERGFEESDLDGAVLVISATDQRELNQRVSELAHARNIPVNVVDQPELCGFIVPSVIDRSPVQIAVSTGGASPVLARLLRARLESTIPAAYGRLARLVDGFRDRVKRRFPSGEQRRRFWEQVLEGPVAQQLFAGKDHAARRSLEAAIEAGDAQLGERGEVYLVGAGPGDPDLLTFRAVRLMQQADVVVYDRLVSKDILELVRRDAELIYAGKERANHAMPQESINQLLVKLAKEGKRVLRLKGGDPFIFGRGGEEIETLMEQGVAFQVVPGVTAAAGCASYSGIPLTHRDHAQSVVFATGHLKDGTLDLNWPALAQPRQTVVFYMGLHGLSVICKELVAHGLPPYTPIALVQQGTTRHQRVVTGTLDTLPAMVKREQIKPPTLIIVGDVVKLHGKLAWFEPAAEEVAPVSEPVPSAAGGRRG